MRNTMPLRWIEQAEAREVLATALFEREPPTSWSRLAREAAESWLPRLRDWYTPASPSGWPMLRAVPVPVRASSYRRPSGGDDRDRCRW